MVLLLATVYADKRAEDSVAPIKDWIAQTAYNDGDVVRLDGESYVVTGAIAAGDNADKSAFKALGTTVELQNSTEPLAKVLQYDGADTYNVGEVVYNDRDGGYYLAAGSRCTLWTGATTALAQTDEIDTKSLVSSSSLVTTCQVSQTTMLGTLDKTIIRVISLASVILQVNSASMRLQPMTSAGLVDPEA